jgi:hypothetical protein
MLKAKELRSAGAVIRKTAGRFFYAQFVKKDGTLRKMVARLGVRRYVAGKGLKFNPSKYHLIVVWDAQKRAYRMVNLKTLQVIRCGEIVWKKPTMEERGPVD